MPRALVVRSPPPLFPSVPSLSFHPRLLSHFVVPCSFFVVAAVCGGFSERRRIVARGRRPRPQGAALDRGHSPRRGPGHPRHLPETSQDALSPRRISLACTLFYERGKFGLSSSRPPPRPPFSRLALLSLYYYYSRGPAVNLVGISTRKTNRNESNWRFFF